MKIVKKIQLKIVIFTAVKNRCMLHRAGRDDVTTGKLVPSRGECLGLYPCILIIFKRK